MKATDGVKALAHITGGGFPENIPRVLPHGVGVNLDLAAIPTPPVSFGWLAKTGGVAANRNAARLQLRYHVQSSAATRLKAAEVEAALRAAGEKPVAFGGDSALPTASSGLPRTL